MKIVADANIVGLDHYFADLADIKVLEGRSLSRTDLQDCDLLLIRSVTQVDQSLLEGTPVQAVASATSGVDHIDLPYLASKDIFFCHALGSNADSVVDYVFSAIASCGEHLGRLLEGGRLGIVGCGQVGHRLLRRAQALGIACSVHDPLLASDNSLTLVDLNEVFGCDVICLHTPLTLGGEFPTYHQVDGERLAGMTEGQLLINAGRGATLDNSALTERVLQGSAPDVVLDVWEYEPEVPAALLEKIHLGTPHIAGYSYSAKRRATAMLRNQLQQAFAHYPVLKLSNLNDEMTAPIINLEAGLSDAKLLRSAIRQAYDIRRDDKALREEILCPKGRISAFDELRRNYPERLEFSDYRMPPDAKITPRQRKLLKACGFGD